MERLTISPIISCRLVDVTHNKRHGFPACGIAPGPASNYPQYESSARSAKESKEHKDQIPVQSQKRPEVSFEQHDDACVVVPSSDTHLGIALVAGLVILTYIRQVGRGLLHRTV